MPREAVPSLHLDESTFATSFFNSTRSSAQEPIMTHESIAHEKDEAAHHEVSEQKSQKGKLRRICGRFWWLYFLLFVIIVLAVVLPM